MIPKLDLLHQRIVKHVEKSYMKVNSLKYLFTCDRTYSDTTSLGGVGRRHLDLEHQLSCYIYTCNYVFIYIKKNRNIEDTKEYKNKKNKKNLTKRQQNYFEQIKWSLFAIS